MGDLARTVRSQQCMTVHLVSQDVLTLAGLRQLLKLCSYVSITGTSTDEDSTMSALTSEVPDVLVLSAGRERDVYAAVRAVRGVDDSLKVVVLTDKNSALQLMATAQVRLEGILTRDADCLQDIGVVLRIVHHGGQVRSNYDEARQDAGSHPISPELAARFGRLSVRETAIMRELTKGRTNAEIAKALHVSIATIKADLAKTMSTTEASSRVDLAVLAVQSGFIG